MHQPDGLLSHLFSRNPLGLKVMRYEYFYLEQHREFLRNFSPNSTQLFSRCLTQHTAQLSLILLGKQQCLCLIIRSPFNQAHYYRDFIQVIQLQTVMQPKMHQSRRSEHKSASEQFLPQVICHGKDYISLWSLKITIFFSTELFAILNQI